MRLIVGIFLCLVLCNINAYCITDSIKFYQGEKINQLDSNGLKIGKWIYFDYTGDMNPSFGNDMEISMMGYYKVIQINNISEYSNDRFESDYYFWHEDKDGLFFIYSGKNGHYFSVPDGIWLFGMEGREVDRIDNWKNGYKTMSYELENGGVVSVVKEYLKNGLSTEDTYKKFDDYVYTRQTWLTPNKEAIEYYPDCEVKLSNKPLNIISTLGKSDSISVYLYSNTNDTLILENFYGFSAQMQLRDKLGCKFRFLKINPHDSIALKLIYTPDRNNLISTEKIYFRTNNKCKHVFTVNVETRAFDLYKGNVNKIKEIRLVKEAASLFLFVWDVEWHTRIKIYDKNRKDLLIKDFLAENAAKSIDISSLPKGKYKLIAESEHEYVFDLVIE